MLIEEQAQPKRSKIDGGGEAKYRQKLMIKAEIIVGAANRLWGRCNASLNYGHLSQTQMLTIGRTTTAG